MRRIRYISIHAPTNGATISYSTASCLLIFQSTLRRTERPPLLCYQRFHLYFNPRSDERSDHISYSTASCLLIFQSTLRRTERQDIFKMGEGKQYFNPRSDERSDSWGNRYPCMGMPISIHAPTNGATNMSWKWRAKEQFQSTLRRTERLLRYLC